MNIRYNSTYRYIIIILTAITFNCNILDEVDESKRISIGLINPSVGSLKGFASLVESGILQINNLQFIAICYEESERDHEQIKKFIDDRDDDLFEFQLIEGNLKPEDLFKTNSLSMQFNKIFRESDGLIFLGGADFSPSFYGEKTSLLTNIHTPHRHNFEISFLFHLLGGSPDPSFQPLLNQNTNYIIIGFCLGMQTMNVATGGTMYQDIPSEIYNKDYVEDVILLDPNTLHKNYWQRLNPDNQMVRANFHKIMRIKSHSFFDDLLWENNQTPSVYSSHHQAIKEPGFNIDIIATSLDKKIPEIISHRQFKNVFGVQFHPEVSSLYLKDGKKYKWFPEDTLRHNYYSYLKDLNSLNFHIALWEKISNLFNQ